LDWDKDNKITQSMPLKKYKITNEKKYLSKILQQEKKNEWLNIQNSLFD